MFTSWTSDFSPLNISTFELCIYIYIYIYIFECRPDASKLDRVANPDEIVAMNHDGQVVLDVVGDARAGNALHITRGHNRRAVLGTPQETFALKSCFCV